MPDELRAVLGQRREFTRSLRTSMYREACRRAALLDAQVERLFDVLRRRRGATVRDLDELIEKLCDQYLERLIAMDRDQRRRAGDEEVDLMPWLHADLIEQVSGQMIEGDRRLVLDAARELLSGARVTLEGEDFDRLCWELQRTMLRAHRISADEWEADFSGRERSWRPASRVSAALGALPVPHAQLPPTPPQHTLSELIRAFIEDRDGKSWTPKTSKQIKGVLQMFFEIIGDRPLSEIRPENVREYKLTLEKLPPRTALVYKGRTILEVLALNREGPKLSPTTISKWLGHVSSMFILGEQLGWIDRNPATHLAPSTSRREEREKRQVFTDEDLRAIFTPLYREATLGEGKYAKFWVPLLCAFTGARLEEMSQLKVADVIEVQSLAVIEIREGEGQSLKTAGSARTVPIHSGLVELGFLEYVETMKKAGHERLFPDLRLMANGNGYGDAVSKWFGRWLRTRAKIEDRRKVLHSFRHTVATRLIHADVAEHVVADLIGHVNASMTSGRYGKKLDVKKLAAALEKLDYGDSLNGIRLPLS